MSSFKAFMCYITDDKVQYLRVYIQNTYLNDKF